MLCSQRIKGQLDTSRLARLIGGWDAAGTECAPAGVGWGVWRISGESQAAGAIPMYIGIALMMPHSGFFHVLS